MMLRVFESKDLPIINHWAELRNLPTMNPQWLPSVGFIAGRSEEHPVAALFLYQTDSKMVILENMISDPMSSPEERKFAVHLLINECTKKAKELGFEIVYVRVENPRVKEKFEIEGFSEIANDCSLLIRSI